MTFPNHNAYGIMILAAGKGTRMNTDRAKVLHELLGKPMVNYVVHTARQIAGHIVIVVGHQGQEVLQKVSGPVIPAWQAQQLGTGHAVQCGLLEIPRRVLQVVILCGDVPLISAATLKRLIKDHEQSQRDITVLAVKMDDPHGYGRLLTNQDGQVVAIVEEVDATPDQRCINIVNSGIYCVKKSVLADLLTRLRADNAQGEYYLTDIIQMGYEDGMQIGAVVTKDVHEVVGVNTIQELHSAEQLLQARATKFA